MGRIDIETEESPNCDCHPMQTFETLAPERQVTELWISGVPGRVRAFVVVGWCIEAGNEQGGPCTLTVVEVTDSGAAVLLLAAGGDYGLRVKPENTGGVIAGRRRPVGASRSCCSIRIPLFARSSPDSGFGTRNFSVRWPEETESHPDRDSRR